MGALCPFPARICELCFSSPVMTHGFLRVVLHAALRKSISFFHFVSYPFLPAWRHPPSAIRSVPVPFRLRLLLLCAQRDPFRNTFLSSVPFRRPSVRPLSWCSWFSSNGPIRVLLLCQVLLLECLFSARSLWVVLFSVHGERLPGPKKRKSAKRIFSAIKLKVLFYIVLYICIYKKHMLLVCGLR